MTTVVLLPSPWGGKHFDLVLTGSQLASTTTILTSPLELREPFFVFSFQCWGSFPGPSICYISTLHTTCPLFIYLFIFCDRISLTLPGLASYSWTSCICFLLGGITSVCHHTQLREPILIVALFASSLPSSLIHVSKLWWKKNLLK
jgi:hypothetical protein